MNEAAQCGMVFERIGRNTLAALAGVSTETLNRPLDLPETNTRFALASHLVGAGEFWTLQLGAGRTVQRDRAAEFRASGTLPDLTARIERWIADVHDAVAPLPDAALGLPSRPPTACRGTLPEGALTARARLLHIVEHGALHLGHIQLTRQLLGA